MPINDSVSAVIHDYIDNERKKDDEHDRLLKELSVDVEQLRHVGVPMWLKVVVFLNLILSVVAIGMILFK